MNNQPWLYFSFMHLCPLHLSAAGCFLSEWSTWSECSATCGGGLSIRNKTILQEPESGGMPCDGPLKQTTVCNTINCLPGNTCFLFIFFTEFRIEFELLHKTNKKQLKTSSTSNTFRIARFQGKSSMCPHFKLCLTHDNGTLYGCRLSCWPDIQWMFRFLSTHLWGFVA